jgi:hypothetical protein
MRTLINSIIHANSCGISITFDTEPNETDDTISFKMSKDGDVFGLKMRSNLPAYSDYRTIRVDNEIEKQILEFKNKENDNQAS